MLKDGQTAMAYYRSMWTPKDLEAAKGLSQKDVFSRFPQSAMETLFGMMAMQKQVEMGNARARKFSDSLEVANKENDLLAMKNTEVLARLDKTEQERNVTNLKDCMIGLALSLVPGTEEGVSERWRHNEWVVKNINNQKLKYAASTKINAGNGPCSKNGDCPTCPNPCITVCGADHKCHCKNCS
ncbi:uncharacterized protein LOC132296094 [Cornus florida]|uniref:uncharacterized protein LOC132296094 n=1 Tax=Cornus florida TaxID=4283 RepID=UPI0028A21795|nr:uncharacterized protein LOC132296094 [Cornus florida]